MKEKLERRKLKVYVVFNDNLRIFKDLTKKLKYIKLDILIKAEFERQRKEDKSQRNEYDRHIEHLPLSEVQINKRAIHKNPNVEDIFLEKEREIIREIWNLPIPQNRRVYMKIVNEFSITEIAKIEQRSIPVIKRSIDRGIITLQKKLKNF